MTRAEYRRLAAQSEAAPSVSEEEAVVEVAEPASGLEVEAAELSSVEEPSLAETVVADVAAAIVAETVAGAQPDEASRRRMRRAARAVFESVAAESATVERATQDGADTSVAGVSTERLIVDSVPLPVADQLPTGSVFVPPAAASESCDVDEFELAARVFSFTGETPVQKAAPAEAADSTAPAASDGVSPHVAPRRRTRGATVVKRMAAASFSVGVMTVVGLLAVGTTTPAAAVASASQASTASQTTVVASSAKSGTKLTSSTDQIQAFVASGTTQPTTLERPDNYSVTSMAELAAESGVRLFANTWVNDPSSPIQYPFPVGVPISAAFGSLAYESEFATPHNGVDLTPGAGAEIHAVAGGTVRIATESGGDYGVTVLIDHIIDGQLVSTRYGHMQYGSLRVKVGDHVTVGQVIGLVGQTGKATGPHLHLEVLLGGTTRIDPMPWLAEHTKGGHTVG